MFMRRGMLALVIVLCVLASASAHAAGEFEAAMKQAFLDGYNIARKEAGHTALSPEEAERATDCVITNVVRGLSVEDRKRLDAWATGGPAPDVELMMRSYELVSKAAFSSNCDQTTTSD
jgi:hypothetical protein